MVGADTCASAVVLDPADNVFVTGGGCGASAFQTTKYDALGQTIWSRAYSYANAYASSIGIDAAGNSYVGGYSATSGEIITIKYDADGNEAWVRRFGPGFGDAVGLVVDPDGNVYVAGRHFVTIKYDTNGNEVWTRAYVGPAASANDRAEAISRDGVGNIYVTGMSRSIVGPCGLGSWDYATIKYDPAGNQLWVARYNEGSSNDPHAVAIDTQGNVFVTGETRNTDAACVPDGSLSFATVKYDVNGQTVWSARHSGGAISQARAIGVDGAGDVYVAGSAGTNWDDRKGHTVKYDPSGNEV